MNIHYDQDKGMGQTPYNLQVNYRGFKCWMYPDMFLKLAKRIFIDPKDTYFLLMKNSIRKGKPIGSPFFQATWDETKQVWEIYSHEGRHRVQAIKEIWPNEQIEVHIIPSGGIRAKDITPQMLQSFIEGVIAEDDTYVEKPTSKIEHLGKPVIPQITQPPQQPPQPMLESMKAEYSSDHGSQKVSFPYKGKRIAYLHGLYVNPKHRGKGEGKNIINMVIKDADDDNVILLLHTREDMIDFFKKFGFHVSNKTKHGFLMFRQPKQSSPKPVKESELKKNSIYSISKMEEQYAVQFIIKKLIPQSVETRNDLHNPYTKGNLTVGEVTKTLKKIKHSKQTNFDRITYQALFQGEPYEFIIFKNYNGILFVRKGSDDTTHRVMSENKEKSNTEKGIDKISEQRALNFILRNLLPKIIDQYNKEASKGLRVDPNVVSKNLQKIQRLPHRITYQSEIPAPTKKGTLTFYFDMVKFGKDMELNIIPITPLRNIGISYIFK